MMREPRSVGYSPLATVVALVIVAAIAAYATPLVNITKPADKEIVSGIADIEVTYTSDSGSPVVRLEVYIDGQSAKDFRLTDPKLQGKQSFRWDFTLATPSTHSISARAMDASGAVGTTGIKVMVQRRAQQALTQQGADRTPPTIDIYYPTEGQVVTGEIQVKADVSDNVGVRTVVFFLDGEFKTMIINSPNYSDRIDTHRLTDGPHVVSASAWDLADNEGKSEERTFVVRNHQATAPGSGQERISRTVPKRPESSPPSLAPPSVPGVELGHEASSATDPSPAAPAAVARGAEEPGRATPDSTPPTATGSEATAATGGEGTSIRPSSSSAALVTETFGSPGGPPRTSPPSRRVARPTPPSARADGSPSERETTPSTGGLVASLPSHTESRPASASESVPISTPLAAPGRRPAAKPSLAPSEGTATEVAMLTNESAARTAVPSESVSAPKTGVLSAVRAVVLASPEPRLSYDPEPLGDLRQERVAVLPTRKMEDERSRSKLGQPASLDVEAMARIRDVKIVFNGELLSLRTAPVVLDGISMAPLREVFEHTDGVLYWFHVEKRVRAVNPQTELELKIGRPTANVNGTQEGLVLAPFIKNGRTMVPLDFIARTLDVTVSFSPDTGELIVSSNKF